MKHPIKTQNLSSKSFSFTPSLLLLLGSYWFYTSICFGYFLSKIFYNLFDTIHKNNLSKRIQFRKKLHLKNLIKTILVFCWKFIQNWLLRIGQKSWYLILALFRSLKPIHIFFKKVSKSPFRFKRNFRLFSILFNIFIEISLMVLSVRYEMSFLHRLRKWLIDCRDIIRCLMEESISITYALYFILLGLFGIVVGFLLGLYRHKYKNENDKINPTYLLILLLLLEMLYNDGFDYRLLRNPNPASNIADPYENFSFGPLPQIESRPFKLILKEPEKVPQIPFPIFDDPSGNVEIDFIWDVWDESFEYKFELFQFYQTLSEKVKH